MSTALATAAVLAWPSLAGAQSRSRIVLLEQEADAGRCWHEAERRVYFDEERLVDVWEVETINRRCAGAVGFDFTADWRPWQPPRDDCDATVEWCRRQHVACRIATQDLKSTCMVEAPSFARSVCCGAHPRGPGGGTATRQMELAVTCGSGEVRFAGEVDEARGEWALRALQSPGDDALYDCSVSYHDPGGCLRTWTDAFAAGLAADVLVSDYLSLVFSVNLRPARYPDLSAACEAGVQARNRTCDAMLQDCAVRASQACR